MAHPRTLISEAVVALLVAANTAAGSRVQGTRIDPHKKSGLPALSVYTLNDPTDDDASSEMEVAHELELEIAGWVAHTEDVSADEAMDLLANEVEVAMRADEYLGGYASDVVLRGTVKEVVEDDGRSSPVVGIVVLTYSVKYHVALETT